MIISEKIKRKVELLIKDVKENECNWLMPMLFNFPTITYWQGWGLAALGGVLFGKININNN